MARSLNNFLLIICFALGGCIERYYPGDEAINTGALVVNAHLSDKAGKQTIQISRSVSISNSSFNPETSCYVEVERSDGESRIFTETEAGYYEQDLDASFLISGSEYRLNILSANGKRYESEYEILHPAPVIENLYYELEDLPTEDPGIVDHGIRFFVDFEMEMDSGRYLRWEMEETFEVHNPDYPTRMYGKDRRWYDITAEQKELICWIYRDIPEIYTMDLKNVAGSSYLKMPLTFVSGYTWKLHYRYSLLLRQYSLGKNAFWYWNELAKNVQSQGGLFDTQPALTPSNICNVEDEDEIVLGYFSISGISERRIFVGTVPGLEVYRDPYFCTPGVFPMFLHRFPQDKLPVYVARATVMGVNENGKVKEECVFCTQYKDSSFEKPEFWED